MTYEEIVQIALGLPEVEEGISYRAPCVKRAGRTMLAPGREPDTIAVKLDWETHNRLLEEHPEVYFKTAHYEGWPWFLARLAELTADAATELIQASWRDAPLPAKRRKIES